MINMIYNSGRASWVENIDLVKLQINDIPALGPTKLRLDLRYKLLCKFSQANIYHIETRALLFVPPY